MSSGSTTTIVTTSPSISLSAIAFLLALVSRAICARPTGAALTRINFDTIGAPRPNAQPGDGSPRLLVGNERTVTAGERAERLFRGDGGDHLEKVPRLVRLGRRLGLQQVDRVHGPSVGAGGGLAINRIT